MATGIALLVELGGIALGDALRQSTAVLLGPCRLGDQLIPVRGIGAQDLPVAHDECDAVGVEVVLQELEGPPQVALPAVRVAG